jgi:two-component system, NtrC family, response regulator AtoC
MNDDIQARRGISDLQETSKAAELQTADAADGSLVLVDDEPHILELQQAALMSVGLNARTFSNPNEAWAFIRQGHTRVVVTDFNMPGMTGMDLLFKSRALARPPHVIVITAYGTVDRAVKAMNGGAFDFLEKPFDISKFTAVVQEAVESQRALSQSTHTRLPGNGSGKPVVQSRAMREVYDKALFAAKTQSSILLLGESGSGKEVITDFIHRHSERVGKPLVKVNCGALPEHLMESELFGYEKGAFTGADRRHTGRFEHASGGTLFLDEIGDLLLPLQVKLLRAIQNRCIERVGSSSSIPVDFRLVCATHCDLTRSIAAGTFREDLYYRINVVPIHVPPLRERIEDVRPLALHFFKQIRAEMRSGPDEFGAEALEALEVHSWPGNVRQLRNAVEYALVMCRDRVIALKDLPEDIRLSRNQPPAQNSAVTTGTATTPAALEVATDGGLRSKVMEAEAALIRNTAESFHWKMTAVAKALKISRASLYERMKQYGIRRPATPEIIS